MIHPMGHLHLVALYFSSVVSALGEEMFFNIGRKELYFEEKYP